jgi:hypothetical protein
MKYRLLALCLLFAYGSAYAQEMMTSGSVKYNITIPELASDEAVFYSLFFKPDMAASMMMTVLDDEVFVDAHSIYDFKKDSMYTTIISDDDTTTLPVFKISETAAKGSLQFVVQEYPVTKKVLGYDCTHFKGYTADSSSVIEGWATRLIQSKFKIILDQSIAVDGLPLLMELSTKTETGMQTIRYEAVEILKTVAEKPFVRWIKTPSTSENRHLRLTIDNEWGQVSGDDGIYLLRVKHKTLGAQFVIEDFKGFVPNRIMADEIPPEYANIPYPERLKKIVELAFQPDKEGSSFVPTLETLTFLGGEAYQYQLCPEKMDPRWNCHFNRLFMFENKPYLFRLEGRKANFEASLSSALKMLETLKSATE